MGRLVLATALMLVIGGLLGMIFRKRPPRGPTEPPARLDDYRKQRKSSDDHPDEDLF